MGGKTSWYATDKHSSETNPLVSTYSKFVRIIWIFISDSLFLFIFSFFPIFHVIQGFEDELHLGLCEDKKIRGGELSFRMHKRNRSAESFLLEEIGKELP